MEVKPFLKSRTVWLAVAQFVASILTAMFAQDPALQSVAALGILKSIADLLIRISTTQPII